MNRGELTAAIHRLQRQHRAAILAHNYQPPEVQDLADHVGDSLELSRIAKDADAAVIVFCGVRFMAETAALLAPDKTILMPAPAARCPMAAMIEADELRDLKRTHPAALVVCYVNSSTEVKAASDVCCTSANVLEIVARVPADREVIFVPDQHLGHYVQATLNRPLIIWPGYCPTHARIQVHHIRAQRAAHPGAPVLVHPECRWDVVQSADAVLGTGGMLRYARSSPAREMIIGTEIGLLHRLHKENPEKRFYAAFEDAICPNMKRTTPASILASLARMESVVELPAEIVTAARRPIERMLAPLAQGARVGDDAWER